MTFLIKNCNVCIFKRVVVSVGRGMERMGKTWGCCTGYITVKSIPKDGDSATFSAYNVSAIISAGYTQKFWCKSSFFSPKSLKFFACFARGANISPMHVFVLILKELLPSLARILYCKRKPNYTKDLIIQM